MPLALQAASSAMRPRTECAVFVAPVRSLFSGCKSPIIAVTRQSLQIHSERHPSKSVRELFETFLKCAEGGAVACIVSLPFSSVPQKSSLTFDRASQRGLIRSKELAHMNSTTKRIRAPQSVIIDCRFEGTPRVKVARDARLPDNPDIDYSRLTRCDSPNTEISSSLTSKQNTVSGKNTVAQSRDQVAQH
jgi:hypothetical protein